MVRKRFRSVSFRTFPPLTPAGSRRFFFYSCLCSPQLLSICHFPFSVVLPPHVLARLATLLASSGRRLGGHGELSMLHQDTASPNFIVVHVVYSPRFHSLMHFVCCPPCSFLRAFAVQFGKPLVSQQTTTKLASKKKAIKSTSCVSSAVMILSLLFVIRCCACSRKHCS